MGNYAGALEDANEALTLAPRYPEVSDGVISIMSQETCATEAKFFWENSWAQNLMILNLVNKRNIHLIADVNIIGTLLTSCIRNVGTCSSTLLK